MSSRPKTFLPAILLGLPALPLLGSPALSQGIDNQVNALFQSGTGWFVALIFSNLPGTNVPWILLWLIAAAFVCSAYFRFIQFRAFRHAIELVRGDYSDPNDKGEVSHFQALATALSGTVGLGNIAGVAVAISIGGPGATFWMICAGFLGMATKFAECTLAVKYRRENADGSVSGGPMYYMRNGFADRGLPGGRLMAFCFALFCAVGSLGGGNMFQSNQAHAQITSVVGAYPGWITGLVFAVIVFVVTVGGVKSIANVTGRVVPLMGVLYVGAALIIIGVNYDAVPTAAMQILRGAFTWDGAVGGAFGALLHGFQRAAFSNEAGVGSAAIAHSAARTRHPVTEGFVALLEPFIDTVVVCTMTALVIIITGQLVTDPATGLFVLNDAGTAIQTADGTSGVELTSAAFTSAFGWFRYVLAVAVILFAFSTMISWSYYGLKAWTYLVGEGRKREVLFRTIFCVFTVVGGASSLESVINFTDASIFAMALFNILALYCLMPVVRSEMTIYLAKLKSGEIRKTAAAATPLGKTSKAG